MVIFTTIFAAIYFEIAIKTTCLKHLKLKTPKIHIYDMVKIDTTVFEIVVGGGGGGLLTPPPDH